MPEQKPKSFRQLAHDKCDEHLDVLLREMDEKNPEKFLKLLDFHAGTSHRWSAPNTLWLMIQDPNLQQPIPIRELPKYGHRLKKGAHLKSIWIPTERRVPAKRAEEPENLDAQETKAEEPENLDAQETKAEEPENLDAQAQAGETEFKVVRSFKLKACVCDLGRDTVGPPILSADNPNEEQNQTLLDAGVAYAIEAGADVAFNTRHSDGIAFNEYFQRERSRTVGGVITGDNTIRINSNLAPDYQFHVLTHELAHMLLGHNSEENKTPEPIRELQAESVAYLVSKHFGQNAPFSATYLQSHGITGKEMRLHLNVIGRVAKEISLGVEQQIAMAEDIQETAKFLIPEEETENEDEMLAASFVP